jgi:hypothetical protein
MKFDRRISAILAFWCNRVGFGASGGFGGVYGQSLFRSNVLR